MRVSIFDPMSLEQGTVFVFTNTNNLLTEALNDQDLNIRPSKFACLNIPMWQNTSGVSQAFYANPDHFGTATQILNPNLLMPALFQNYLDNLSLYATDSMTANNLTFTESAMWKMFQRTWTFAPIYNATTNMFAQNTSAGWNKFVTYIGDTIDLGTHDVNGTNYTEMFMHIPSNALPVDAKWQTIQYAGLQNVAAFPLNGEYVPNALGLTTGDATFVKALYDLDGLNETTYYDISKATDKLQLKFNNIETVSGDIEFNAIAIYADVWRTSAPESVTRILHSIFVTRTWEVDSIVGGTWALKTYVKKAPSTTGQSSASLAFRLCTRMSACNVELSPVQVSAIDGISLDMYIASLQTMNEQSGRIIELQKSVVDLSALVQRQILGVGMATDAITEIDRLRERLNAMSLYISNDKLIDLFVKLSADMQSSEKQIINNIIVNHVPDLESLS